MRLFKRICSFGLSVVFALTVLPLHGIFANLQANISNLRIADVPLPSTEDSADYSINLSWTNPTAWSSVADPNALDGSERHSPVGYKIEEFDATTNTGNYEEIDSALGADVTSVTERRSLTNGHIYNYRVIPYHYHNTNDGQTTVLPDRGKAEVVLYMADITVNSEIQGESITVTWDEPKYKGTRIFDKYKIYYIRGDSNELVSFSDGSTEVDVPVDKATVVENGKRLSYTIEDDEIINGEYYAVKVEPVYGNQLLRDVSDGLSYKEIRIDGVNYKMAFRDMVTHEFRSTAASKVTLTYSEEGGQYIDLKWTGVSNTAGNVRRIEVLMYDAQELSQQEGPNNENAKKVEYGTGENMTYKYYLFNNESIIGTINSASATYVTNWKTNKPKKLKGYLIRIYVEGKTDPIESNYVVLPEETLIAPNAPDLYLSYDSDNNRIEISWEVAKRYPYTEAEKESVDEDGMYTDFDVVYDIWVTDQYDNFNRANMPPVFENIGVSASFLKTINDAGDIGFSEYAQSYYTLTADDTIELVEGITGNKNYYVKIVAKNAKNTSYKSGPMYAAVYVKTTDDISTPPALSKPPLELVDDVTDLSTLQVRWDSEWFEIYDAATDDWYTKVSVDYGGNLIFGDDADEENLINFYSAPNEERAREILEQEGVGAVDEIIMRHIDLSTLALDKDISYEMVYKPISDISKNGGYLEYVKALIKSDATDWMQITPESDGKHFTYTLTGLERDTTYVIIVRAYRINSLGQKEAYPAFVIGSTKNTVDESDITPTVPILEEVKVGDTYFTVKWEEHIPNLEYEIAINETNLDDPSKAMILGNMEEILAHGSKYAEDGYNYINYTQENLFPATGYYIWARSIAPNNGNAITSVWSNPLYIETEPLIQPDPPSGLGPVSSYDLAIYNRAKSTSYLSIDYNYFIVQWNKNYYDDKNFPSTTKATDLYEVFENPEIKDRISVLFKDLIANTEYFLRAKTVHIVRRAEGGRGGSEAIKSESIYAYVLQMSPTDDFKDVVEVVTPIDIPEGTSSADKIYVIESEWCDVVKLITEPSEYEYDANKDPNLYPLPTEDYEILYNGTNGELIYRFRSNEVDADKNDDNGVDQRFISRLIQNNTFTYKVDLTNYNGNFIKTRTLEIPYSIIAAFDERKINLEVTANNMTVTFPPEFLRISDVVNRYDYGTGSKITLKIQEKPEGLPTLNYNQSYLSVPQSVSAEVKTPTTIVNVKTTAQPVKIALKTENRYDAVDSNVSAYYNDSEMDKLWTRVESSFDNATGNYSFTTGKLNTYTVLSVSAPSPMGNNADALGNIGTFQSKINITDISSFNPQKAVSVVEFNNIIAAIAAGKHDVALNSAISSEDYTALSRKGILATGSVISRQQAVSSLIALYEAKTKSRVYSYSSLDTTSFPDIADADPQYQAAMLKAGDLGFFDNSNGARPKDVLGLNELLYMADIVLEDSNY